MSMRTYSLLLLAGVAIVADCRDGPRAAAPPVKARLDLYGDPLPTGAIARLGTVRWRARGGIWRIAFVPGDKYLVTGSSDAFSVWDLGTGRVVRTISATVTPLENDCGREFVFTSDGKRVLLADSVPETNAFTGQPVRGRKPTLLLWDLGSGKVLARTPALPGTPYLPAISPDGRQAACFVSRVGDILLWDLETKALRPVIRGKQYGGGISYLTFTRDGKQLLLVTSRRRAPERWLFDIATGKLLSRVDVAFCTRFALAEGHGTIATYRPPDQLHLYDPDTGKKRRLPLKEKVSYLDLSFSPDGRTLLAVDREAEIVQFWDVAKGQLRRRLRVPGLARTHQNADLLLSGDGKTLASREEHSVVRVWDASTGQPRLRFPGHVRTPDWLAFSADGKEIVSHAFRDNSPTGEVYRWEAATGKFLARVDLELSDDDFPLSHGVWSMPPLGRYVFERFRQSVRLYDTRTGKRIIVRSPDSRLTPLTVSPDGRTLVTNGPEQSLRRWDARTGKLLRWQRLGKRIKEVSWICFSPEGHTLATGEGWQKVHLWNASTGEHRATLLLPDKRKPFGGALSGWQTTFSPDGRYLFVSSTGMLWVWDVPARREIGPFQRDQHKWAVWGSGPVAVSADSRFLAWFDSVWALCLYEIASGQIIHHFTDQSGPSINTEDTAMAFSPSGWRLALGCTADRSILLWDLPSLFRSFAPLHEPATPETLWADLAHKDAALAHRSLWRLAALPEADAFLARRLSAVDKLPKNHMQPRTPERLQQARAVLVLEARGTPEARRLLRHLTTGLPQARLTQEAKGALQRLQRSKP
jgi:WD40 repeat protein